MNLNNQIEVRVALEAQDSIETTQSYQLPKTVPKGCFRIYDIRGPVDSAHITPELTYAIGLGIGSEARARGIVKIFVARDGRLSGPELVKALIAGLRAAGVDVTFIGIVPTPVLYFATNYLDIKSGVMLTASHNPKNHNGFKIVLGGQTLKQQEIENLYQRIVKRDFVYGKGELTQQIVVNDYINYICDRIKLKRSFKVVVDCGNGAGSEIAPQVYQKLGCEVVPLYCEIDGNFPNHHPDPTVPVNLIDLIKKVKDTNADVGLALDGDADRIGVITNEGEIIWPDRQMMLFATEVLQKHPGEKIIFDVKCSSNLAKVIQQHGGVPVMWRTGHSVIKAKLFDLDSPFAGELSGHIFFRDEWFGFDDGIYVGARLLRIMAGEDRSVSEIFKALPNNINTPELKLPMRDDQKAEFMQRFINEGVFSNAKKITLDGVRLEYSDGWALVRPSNTSSYLILRFEADSKSAMNRIQAEIKQQLLKLDPALQVPY